MGKAVFGCGVVLLVVMIAIGSIDARAEVTGFLILIMTAAGAYVVALWLIARSGGASRRGLVICLIMALAWRIPLLTSAPLLSDDVYRYVWDGRIQRLGYNPYASAPADPALEEVHTAVTRKIDPTSAVLPTIYPPAAELFFRGVTSIHESVRAMTLAMLVCDVLIVLAILQWLVTTQRDPWWVLAYAWHPLVAIEGGRCARRRPGCSVRHADRVLARQTADDGGGGIAWRRHHREVPADRVSAAPVAPDPDA